MKEQPSSEMNYKMVSVWLERAKSNAAKCFVCMRIAEGNGEKGADLRSIRISGIELTAETQIEHLARCVGKEEARA